MFIRLFLIVALFPLQSCSNTLIGEKLENSFDTTKKPIISVASTKAKDQKNLKEMKNIKLSKIDKDKDKDNENIKEIITKENSISNKDRFSQKLTKSKKKVIFNPQPYRIILKLSGANPSAPAETVTNALRKAGVQFEVEKIERFDKETLFKDTSMKR
tara:strand:+ start:506 stop:979 length:474 start_codon:yes stop_codon:yes gene_type:complete